MKAPPPHERQGDYIAVLDLGTMTCRLLIAKRTPYGPKVVSSFVRIIRLGEGLATSGVLSSAAMARAITALDLCAKKLRTYNISHLRCVATAACREASNQEDFLKAVRHETGLELEVISTAQEAQLAIAGCADILDPNIPYAIGCDIGGGSTEIMWIKLSKDKFPKLIAHVSLPLGIVTLNEMLGTNTDFYPSLQEVRKTVSEEAQLFADKVGVETHLKRREVQLITTSGTFTTLAAVHLNLKYYNPKKVHGQKLSTKVIKDTIASVYKMSRNERLSHPCIGPRRVDLVLGGVAIFEGIYDVFPIQPVRVATHGVREGLLHTVVTPP